MPIHLIGGVADSSTAAQTRGFVRAARECGVIGASLYTTGAPPRSTLVEPERGQAPAGADARLLTRSDLLEVARRGPVEPLEPRLRPEPLEDLAGLGKERLGFIRSPLSSQPLAVLGSVTASQNDSSTSRNAAAAALRPGSTRSSSPRRAASSALKRASWAPMDGGFLPERARP